MSATGDPVRLGLVPSLSRPGGNITGVTTFSPELSAKRLQLLRELVPALKRVGTFVNPANEYARLVRDDDEQNFRPIWKEVSRLFRSYGRKPWFLAAIPCSSPTATASPA